MKCLNLCVIEQAIVVKEFVVISRISKDLVPASSYLQKKKKNIKEIIHHASTAHTNIAFKLAQILEIQQPINEPIMTISDCHLNYINVRA